PSKISITKTKVLLKILFNKKLKALALLHLLQKFQVRVENNPYSISDKQRKNISQLIWQFVTITTRPNIV
ncbi:hypothetical protein J0J37_22725, partial [Vibrio vulnificus]|uniref:hypothetical protein n=1 Tax=Vibrio vulnificus TaxID=672 RepID=UPI0019D41487